MTRLALLSVSDKTGLVDFAKRLLELDFELLSTGGTASLLRDASLPVTSVADYTGSPEVMGGRVKTLHPRVHGGILARATESDLSELESLGGRPIDLVCVNLYPFRETIAKGVPLAEAIEQIDIGGPSMLRSAAKNHERVWVVSNPEDYLRVSEALRDGQSELRRELAGAAFTHTAAYDGAIAAYLSGGEGVFPGVLTMQFRKAYDLRYGENPHQVGAFYTAANAAEGSLARADSLGMGGKELSFNNLVDVDATLECVREFEEPAAVVVKHTNPCGVATSSSLEEAYRVARAADPESAFGGIVALNREVDLATAEALAETYLECVIAPNFADDALARLRRKKKLRILATREWLPADAPMLHFKRVSGGVVVQSRDACAEAELENAVVVTKRDLAPGEREALELAWKVAKHVKSNAIIFAKQDRTVGIGAGQMSRVMAVRIAALRAGEEAAGAVMASDAFFPFPDAIEAAAEAGIKAVIQPGGSVKDDEVIAACDRLGISMVMTGVRHFKH